MDGLDFDRLNVVYIMVTDIYTEYIISYDGGRTEFNFILHNN